VLLWGAGHSPFTSLSSAILCAALRRRTFAVHLTLVSYPLCCFEVSDIRLSPHSRQLSSVLLWGVGHSPFTSLSSAILCAALRRRTFAFHLTLVSYPLCCFEASDIRLSPHSRQLSSVLLWGAGHSPFTSLSSAILCAALRRRTFAFHLTLVSYPLCCHHRAQCTGTTTGRSELGFSGTALFNRRRSGTYWCMHEHVIFLKYSCRRIIFIKCINHHHHITSRI
jgi:hypothetical protein